MGQSQSATAPNVKTLVSGVVYEFHKPENVEVEIVFIHGLQIGKFENAYWKTWCARDEHKTCWAQSWISEKYENARILSLSYNSEALQRRTETRLGPKDLSENLLQLMVLPTADIGQSGCPLIFVCHSLGGLIAKQIVVCAASEKHSRNSEIRQLLGNVRGFFFFATPHLGSNLVKSHIVQFGKRIGVLGCVKLTLLVKFLQVLNRESQELNVAFMRYKLKYNWKLYVVSEGMQTAHQACGMSLCPTWVVERTSAECFGELDGFINLQDSDHRTVCKPNNKEDGGFQFLLECISKVLDDHRRRVENQKVKLPDVFGLERKVEEIRECFQSGVSIVALVGMGGAGKTTLSKYYYNEERKNYKKSSYLEEVATKTIQEVQKQLFRDLFPYERVENFHLDKIKRCLKKEKVLVVVDNLEVVDDVKQSPGASWTLGAKDSLGFDEGINDSRVVVTCRNEEYLRQFRVGPLSLGVVKATGIRDSDRSDRALFHHHAFDRFGDMKNTFKGLTEEILEQCDGLPLSLKVVGEYLNDVLDEEKSSISNRERRWKEALQGLKEGKSITGGKNERLWSCLRVSYNQLAPEEDMFLGFACILSEVSVWNQPRRNAVGWIWDSLNGIQHLIKRSLIRAEGQDNERLSIHNQLRDMGRNIVKDISNGDISKQTYIWKSEDVLQFLQNNESSTTLRGLSLKLCFDGKSIARIESWLEEASTQNSLQQYSQLELLHLSEIDACRVVDYCLSKCSEHKLRWLYVDSSDMTEKGMQRISLLQELRVLHIHDVNVLNEVSQVLFNLTNLLQLEIVDCENFLSLQIIETSSMYQLEKLRIECSKIKTITGLGNLHKLRTLEFYCPEVDVCDLPRSLGKLSQLEKCVVLEACEFVLQELCNAFINVGEHELPNLEELWWPSSPNYGLGLPRWNNAMIKGEFSANISLESYIIRTSEKLSRKLMTIRSITTSLGSLVDMQ